MGIRKKVLQLEDDIVRAYETWARETNTPLSTVIDQALRAYLKQQRRPVTLKEALRESARLEPANDAKRGTSRKRQRP